MKNSYSFLTNQLNEVETRVVTSIINHIENGEERVVIAQIAAENYVSPAFIIKMCKRLGYNGYTDLVYKLSLQHENDLLKRPSYELEALVDHYSDEDIHKFIGFLHEFHDQKLFVVGAGFADIVAEYISHRLAVCGFMVFNRVHFYDYMLFRDATTAPMKNNVSPAILIAISQSGETTTVLNDVERARTNGFRVVSFTKMQHSKLAELSDLVFLIDSARETLLSPLPNSFFGKVILAFDEMISLYFHDARES